MFFQPLHPYKALNSGMYRCTVTTNSLAGLTPLVKWLAHVYLGHFTKREIFLQMIRWGEAKKTKKNMLLEGRWIIHIPTHIHARTLVKGREQ